MSKIRLRVAQLEDVDVPMRAFYRRDGDAYVLDHEPDEDGYGIANVAALRGKIAAAEKKAAQTREHLLERDDGSLYTREDIGKYEQRIADLEKQLADGATDEDALAQAVAEATKPLEQELGDLRGRADSYRERVLAAEADRIVRRTMQRVGEPLPEFTKFIEADLRRQLRVDEAEDGSVVASWLDEDGQPREQSVDDLVPAWQREYGRILRGDDKDGGGPIGSHRHPVRPPSRDVRIPAGADQTTFENAYRQARAQGGEVVIDGGQV